MSPKEIHQTGASQEQLLSLQTLLLGVQSGEESNDLLVEMQMFVQELKRGEEEEEKIPEGLQSRLLHGKCWKHCLFQRVITSTRNNMQNCPPTPDL